jgi:hypothetical protein
MQGQPILGKIRDGDGSQADASNDNVAEIQEICPAWIENSVKQRVEGDSVPVDVGGPNFDDLVVRTISKVEQHELLPVVRVDFAWDDIELEICA